MEPAVDASSLDFFIKNWGNIASVIGAVLTVFYAWGAKSAAVAAKEAAMGAQARIYAVDYVLHFSSIVVEIDSLLQRILSDVDDWHRISNDCTKLRSFAAVAKQADEKLLDEETRRRLVRSPTQFLSISQVVLSPDQPDRSVQLMKIKKVLSDQRELYSVALNQVKQKAAGSGHGQ